MKPLPLTALAAITALALALLGTGCANTTTTKVYRTADGAWIVQSPKDIDAQGIDFQTPKGTRLHVQSWTSRTNPAVTIAQGKRETANIDASAALAAKAAAAAASAAVKSALGGVPIPIRIPQTNP